MPGATGIVAVSVDEWVGLAFLRCGWLNLDPIRTASLAVTGLILLVTASLPMRASSTNTYPVGTRSRGDEPAHRSRGRRGGRSA
jgi:hypothetical protein